MDGIGFVASRQSALLTAHAEANRRAVEMWTIVLCMSGDK
jgi:hypothetical protein